MRKCLFHLIAPILLFCSFCSVNIFGQSIELLEQLKKDTLYFKVPDHRQKIEALRQLEKEGNTPGKYQDQISALQSEDREIWRKLQIALDSIYSFSAFQLVPSKNYISWKAKQKEDKFVAYWGNVESGATALLIADIELQPYAKPFPYFVRIHTFGTFFNSIFYPKYARDNEYLDLIIRLDKKLSKAYEKSQS